MFNIIVFVTPWHEKMTIRDKKKSPLNEIDVQMAPIQLFLIILIVFIMICIMLMQNDTLLEIWVFLMPWQKIISGPKIPWRVKLQALLLLWNVTPKGLINHITNIPKNPSTQNYRKVLSFHYTVTEKSDSKVITDFFIKSYL